LIDEPEHSGLIIGREGQTLSSLQYLVNRIVSRRMDTSVRVQIDTGDYRERQDDKLREIADHLAGKALKSGRTQSTKPLSSYHRRIVHLTLQEDDRVFTRSKGEGPMKRVLVVPKKRRGGSDGGQDDANETNGNR
ncbi:MAG: KH domain-containing protein, partial [Proteobacteria bacterium]|nr:KH domain-containing protein [Pseudomonadota bacterium]